ncbi:MAG: thermonuclease family protein [Paracoccaceae bacterium]|nr:thermonuclease family protein [Paracoccaceae bacterium]
MLLVIAIGVVALRETRTAMRVAVMGASSCEVVNVIDGDTVNTYCPGSGYARTRLVGFDTPEVYSPKCLSEYLAGIKATFALRRVIWGASESRLVFEGTDRYGRRLASLFLDGANVSPLMIDAGQGRAYAGGRRGGWCE